MKGINYDKPVNLPAATPPGIRPGQAAATAGMELQNCGSRSTVQFK
jgi:hypothetical protein